MRAFERYAEYYDLIYQDKDYEKECDFVEEIFHKFSLSPAKTILDGGCGTGGHAMPLANRGYQVIGIDSSAIMLEHAKRKAIQSNLSIDFRVGDLREFNLPQKFDAAICMFAVMDYITETEDLIRALKNIRRHLDKGSLFTFDFWNGEAVLRIQPAVRVKIVQNKELRIIRVAEPELDSINNLCRVSYRLLIVKDSTLVDEVLETHTVRYYFPQEITHYLDDAGFEVLRICPFPNMDGKVDESVWNLAAIAKAV